MNAADARFKTNANLSKQRAIFLIVEHIENAIHEAACSGYALVENPLCDFPHRNRLLPIEIRYAKYHLRKNGFDVTPPDEGGEQFIVSW